MQKTVDVIIIGTGTAALSAAAELRKAGKNFVIISNGVYGTTCVRAGCMPSKALIHAANLYHQRFSMGDVGITGTGNLNLDQAATMNYVRKLRSHFLEHTLKLTEKFRAHIVEGKARFTSANIVQVNDDTYKAKSIILATGSRPHIPADLKDFAEYTITSDDVFELEKLPSTIAVIGMGILGSEMAQCFARLGSKVFGYESHSSIAGLTDPEISRYLVNSLQNEMAVKLNTKPHVKLVKGKLMVDDAEVEKIFVAAHRVANLENLGLEELGIIKGGCIDNFDPHTMQISNSPIFVAGDVKVGRSILNEAVDEGKIAAWNAVADEVKPYPRRTALQICHTGLPAAIAGKSFDELDADEIVIGESDFEDQGCAKIIGNNSGKVHIYANHGGELLGAELTAPKGEELAHMLSWLIARKTTVREALELPYYHPSLAEGLKTALNDLSHKLDSALKRKPPSMKAG